VNTSIRTRLLLALLGVALIAAAGLSAYYLNELEAYGLRKLDERLAAEVRLAAALASSSGVKDPGPLQQSIGNIDRAPRSRLLILDGTGTAIADSAGDEALRRSAARSFASRPEVAQALAGTYGSATRSAGSGKTVRLATAPVVQDGEVVGTAYAWAELLGRDAPLGLPPGLVAVVALFVVGTWLVAGCSPAGSPLRSRPRASGRGIRGR
jgi:hypothetical protein